MIQILHITWNGPGPGVSSYKSNNLERIVTWKMEGTLRKAQKFWRGPKRTNKVETVLGKAAAMWPSNTEQNRAKLSTTEHN